jgi:hypothetical protein
VKPLLLLDVDGVLSRFGGSTPPPSFERTVIDGFQVTWSSRHAAWLRDLGQWFDFVWATTWEHKAPTMLLRPRPSVSSRRALSCG